MTEDEARASPTPSEIAEAVNAAKLATLGMLVAGLAHEINTPLGALSSNHHSLKRALERLQDILADEVVDETELEEVRRIVRALDGILRVNDLAVDRIQGLVGSLRAFGRLDRAEVDVVDLHESLETVVTLAAHRLEDRIGVVREFGELPLVECFPQQIHQVFMNLILNAIDAIEGSGTLTVRTRGEGGGVVVEVADTGSGIDPGDLERIFDPGFTTKGSRVGMGMGLLIARQIVDRHGGRIEVESEPGRGSTFSVHLPPRLPRPRDADPSGRGRGGAAPDGRPGEDDGSPDRRNPPG